MKTFIRTNAVTLVWSGTLLVLMLAATVWPGLTWLAFVLEVAIVAAAWVALFEWRAERARRDYARMRAERDESREMVNALLELVHQHHLATIRDRDCGPDAYQRASDLAEAARQVRFPELYGERAA